MQATRISSAPATPSVVTPGNHDGVHLGHRALLRSARQYAEAHGLCTRALTFDPHPMALLDPSNAPPILTTFARRSELLRYAGADKVNVQPFDQAFAEKTAEEFLQWLVAQNVRALVVGPDFRFGCKRSGDVALLQTRGKALGLTTLIEEPVMLDGQRVSSSAVRAALNEGDVALAARRLGRFHEISGRVVQGDQRGRTLGFPTANLDAEPVLRPKDGVYAVVARLLQPTRSELLLGVANLGTRPTMNAGRSLEVHLFDFDRDVYGTELRVGFVERIRGETRFGSLAELQAQITKDCEQAKLCLQARARELESWI